MEQLVVALAVIYFGSLMWNKIFPPKETPLQKLMKNEKVKGFAKEKGLELLGRMLKR